MTTRFLVHATCLLLSITFGSIALAQTSSLPAAAPSDVEIRKILADRIDVYKKSIGIVVGVITPQGSRVVSYGTFSTDDRRVPSRDSVLEIGSISKVFTSLLLCDMVKRGEVKLDDPVAKFLPPSVHVPERDGKQITLLDLAMHISALPRMPSNFVPQDPTNPYADYTIQQMYNFISGYELPRNIGEKYEYSNLAVGLLGHALARRAGTDYETLLRKRILKPLRMTSTSVVLTDSMRSRLVPGHTATLKPTSNWDIPTLTGAGGIRSTTNDLLTFLAVHMGLKSTSLRPAMQMMLTKRRPAAKENIEIAIGWHIISHYDDDIIWHNGGTGGYHSFAGFDPKKRLGVVVLSNSSNDIDDIGRHLIDPRYELVKPSLPQESKPIAGSPVVLNDYVGIELYVQEAGLQKRQMFPEPPFGYYASKLDTRIPFVRNRQAK